MSLRNALKEITSELYECIKPQKVDFNELKGVQNLFVIQSASLELFREFYSKLVKENDTIKLYVLTHSQNKDMIIQLCGEDCKVICYNGSGNYNIENCEEDIQSLLKSTKIEKCLIFYNNRYGYSYENVEEIALLVSSKEVLVYNTFSELMKIDNLSLRMESSKALYSLSCWFWEYCLTLNQINEVERC